MDALHTALGWLTGLAFVAATPLDWPTLLATTAVVNTCDAIICRVIARNNGRPTRLWFGLGLVFGVWAIATLLLVPSRLIAPERE
jgi:hypothetical protein